MEDQGFRAVLTGNWVLTRLLCFKKLGLGFERFDAFVRYMKYAKQGKISEGVKGQ
jgi:hypothetical protein